MAEAQTTEIPVDPVGVILNAEDSVTQEEVNLLQRELHPEGHEAVAEDDDELEASGGKRDTELEAAATDEDRDRIRANRRQERKSRQLRAKERIESQSRKIEGLEQTVAGLQQMMGGLQNNVLGQSLARVDQEIQFSTRQLQEATAIEAEALTKSDGKTAVEAREIAAQARQRVESLTGLKRRALQNAQQPAPLDSEQVRRTNEWRTRNGWFDNTKGDMDSALATTIDNSVRQAGFDPRTEAYWQELDARIAKHLPHRATRANNGNEGAQSTQSRAQPVAGANGNSGLSAGGTGNGSGGSFELAPAMVQAIKDAGMWDDPKQRQRMINRYRDSSRTRH